MLEKPSINDLTEKIGENRYLTSILVAKRARQIADKRIKMESDDIRDCVELATNEFFEGEAVVVKEPVEKDQEEEQEEVIE